ncbi:hypothetical protein [Actinacidiphila sp. ITFR-21]|nr:hypothetical protein [Streptomyces sp. ITFR-21]WNI17620.1 hypothetical protein RLT57_20235 [Streptomyces sp. ITFR-21]WNI17760.1 hypothetical protein RLT57_20950 [Streptomyces sp. ITFR-21]
MGLSLHRRQAHPSGRESAMTVAQIFGLVLVVLLIIIVLKITGIF